MASMHAGVKEAGYPGPPVPSYDITVGTAVLPPTRKHLSAFMNALLAALRGLDESCHFREAVDGDEVTDYYDIIKNPMDLGTMQVRRRCTPRPAPLHHGTPLHINVIR